MRSEVVDLIMERDDLAELDPAARRLALRALLCEEMGPDAAVCAAELSDLIDGHGPLSDAMRDPAVTDILVNGPREVWIERAGCLERSDAAFADETALHAYVERVVSTSGGRVDMSRPVADARLPDGSRIHVVLPPLAPHGPIVSIRKFPSDAFTLDDLARLSMLSEPQMDALRDAVRDRRTIAISGGTGTGKTTLLNALLGEVPESERVVVIEETPELRPRCGHFVSLVARPPNVEGKGAVELRELLRASLRMRPDRIVVGEVRGPEALVALDAMSTGHEGSFVTVHARSASDVLDRLVALAMQGSVAGVSELRARFVRAFDLVVHLERVGGRRIVVAIEEVN